MSSWRVLNRIRIGSQLIHFPEETRHGIGDVGLEFEDALLAERVRNDFPFPGVVCSVSRVLFIGTVHRNNEVTNFSSHPVQKEEKNANKQPSLVSHESIVWRAGQGWVEMLSVVAEVVLNQ